LFSLHLAVVGMSMAFTSIAVSAPFSRMECRINVFLHIRQTDFVRGYFAIWIPSVLVAFLIWFMLRTFASKRLTQRFLRSLAGIITIVAPLAFWVFTYEMTFWPVGRPYVGASFEMATAVVCSLLFLSGKWKVPSWVSLLLIAVHYFFWYSGPSGQILGFCSAVAWGLYVSRLRRIEAVGTPLVP
jgi:chromate transport protein ChrA